MGEIIYDRIGAAAPAASPTGGEPATSEPAIEVIGLTKDYKTVRALEDVSFSLPKGKTIGLVGSNGAGKSTTIFAIMGLLAPTFGKVRVLGNDMARTPHKVLRRMNFASPYMNMPGRLTVRQNLMLFGRLYGVPSLKKRVADLAAEFEIGDALDRPLAMLSAGQKTRVSLAKALLNTPEVLILDEPTASLDPERTEWVHARLEEHQRTHNASILLASHNMAEVQRLCSSVAIMRRGRIVDTGTPIELLQRYHCDFLGEVLYYLSVPPSTEAERGVA